MPRVWVVMDNDFPRAVYTNLTAANEHCRIKRTRHVQWMTKVYWNVYEFDLLEEFRDV